jgi:hypothetical protein
MTGKDGEEEANRFRRYRLSMEHKYIRQKSPVWSLLYRNGDEPEIWIETTRLTAIFVTTAGGSWP